MATLAERISWKATRIGARIAPVRRLLVRYHEWRKHDGWSRVHPIDREYGISTSGFIPGYLLERGASVATAYVGCQPSVVRRGLDRIVDAPETTLVDLGCGKGRVLVVASERSFRAIVGVEIATSVARIARKNVEIVRRAFPQRPQIAVVTGDASTYVFPDGPLALFLYHPFGEEPTRTLVRRIEERLERDRAPLTIVSCNPVYGEFFDASPALVRAHAFETAYEPGEIGYGSDGSDTIVVWRDRRGAHAGASGAADRSIVVTKPGWRARLGPMVYDAETP